MDPEDPARKAHTPSTAPGGPDAGASPTSAAGVPASDSGAASVPDSPARELRVAVTVDDYEAAVRFYRDALGLPVIESWDQGQDRRGMVLAAGRATLELLSTAQTDLVDQIETADPQPDTGGPGRAGAGPPVRLAIEVDDSAAAAEALVASGAERLGGPVITPWQHRNVRLQAPDGMQLTLFTVLDPDDR